MTTSLYTAELLRPDDMLDLLVGVAGEFDLDTTGAEPLLRRTDTAQPAYLFIALGPQWIGEQAYHENDPVPTPGTTAARISFLSRLVFEIPETVSEIPFTFAGLLDWSALRLVVSPLASWGSGMQSEGPPPPIIPPGIAETALELPYRLVMSPNPNAKWEHVDHPVTFAGRTELWHTRLAIGEGESAPLWAIWSPDFKSIDGTKQDNYGEFNLSSSSVRQRAELVALTVGFGLRLQGPHGSYATAPVQARRLLLSQLGAWLHWEGSWQPTEIFRRWFAVPVVGREPAVPLTLAQVEAGPEPGVKQAVQAGGAAAAVARTLDSSAAIGVARAKATVADQFTRVLAERAGRLESAASLIGKGFPVGGVGDIELLGWTHSGTGGRDQFVKIDVLGQCCPFGHRATLTTVTERRFDPGGQDSGLPVAYLIQYQYLTIEQPVVSFAGTWETKGGREMPLASVRLKTLITPHLLDPNTVDPNPSKVDGITGVSTPSMPRWIVADDSNDSNKDVVFHAVGVDRHGREVPFSASLIFVPDSVFDTDGNTVASAYNDAKERRKCQVPRQLMTFAPPDPQVGDEDTALATEALFFDSKVSGNTFTATLSSAAVRVPAVSRLTGHDVPMNIELYQDYLDKGIDAVHGVFAQVPDLDPPVGVAVSADQAGGFVTPNLAVKGLQRGAGPVAGTLKNAAQNNFDPADFFAAPLPDLPVSKLFDSIKLADLAKTGTGDKAPRLTTSLVRDPGGTPVATSTTLAWTPNVQPTVNEGPLTLTFNKNEQTTVLDIKAEVTTPFAQGATATTEVSGSLTNFQITLLGVVSVVFNHFKIHSLSGAKPVVDLELADKMVFEGDLAFLNKLADLFDPAGLSDPPYVDVTPTGLVAGFGQALPPLPIGVLELHDLRLDAAFSLPFLSGRPQLNLAFSSREHPLVITVSALGGGGFLHLEFDTKGVVMIEGSLEFGGEFALDIGVASGGVHLMAGIYLRVDKSSTPEVSQLTGFVDLAGEVSVLGLVSLSVDFYLTLTYVENKATGRAELTVSISVAFFSTSVTMSVERSFGNGSGDPSAADVFPSYADWQSYAEAFA